MGRTAMSVAQFAERSRILTLALIIAGLSASTVQADEDVRPRLLEGAVFWVGNPLAAKGKGSAASVTALAFSPDGKRLVIGESSGRVSIFDTQNGKKLRSAQAHDSEIVAIAFRPRIEAWLTAAKDGTIREWGVSGEH